MKTEFNFVELPNLGDSGYTDSYKQKKPVKINRFVQEISLKFFGFKNILYAIFTFGLRRN